jgi:uncharacterized protein (TIGR02598 family)
MKKLEILDFGLRILDWVPWRRDFGWKARSFARRGICCKRILDCGLGNRGLETLYFVSWRKPSSGKAQANSGPARCEHLFNPKSKIQNPKFSAFSLVEVTLALGIVSFALISVLGLMPVGLKVVKNANEQAGAATVLSSLARAVRAATTTDNSNFKWTFNGTDYTYTIGSPTNGITIDNLNLEGRTDAALKRLKARVEFAPPSSLTTSGQGTISVAWSAQANPTWNATLKAWANADGSVTTGIQFLPKP